MAQIEELGIGFSEEDTEALRRLACQTRRQTCVEVGCWVGRTTRMLSDLFGRTFVVDTWEGSAGDCTGMIVKEVGSDEVFRVFASNVGSRLFRSVFPLRGESSSWGRIFPRRMADLVFIDASHEEASVRQDLEAWWPCVVEGGILCGHDYGHPEFPGVAKAVDDIRGGEVKRAGRSVWWVRKPGWERRDARAGGMAQGARAP